MISHIKMGVASTIRDVLKLKPKVTTVDKLQIGEYFEFQDNIYVNIDGRHAFDDNGCPCIFTDEKVRPVNAKLEYDYVLIDEDGKEAMYLD